MSGISPETLAVWGFALQVFTAALVPAVIAMARFLWKIDRRTYRIEIELGLDTRGRITMNDPVTDQGMAILFGFWAALALVFVWFADRIDGQEKARRSGPKRERGESADNGPGLSDEETAGLVQSDADGSAVLVNPADHGGMLPPVAGDHYPVTSSPRSALIGRGFKVHR